jgi:hypothetical protein
LQTEQVFRKISKIESSISKGIPYAIDRVPYGIDRVPYVIDRVPYVIDRVP